MADIKRVTRHSGDIARYFGYEDGVAYRGHRQNVEAIKSHVAFMDAKVNGAPSRGNPREWTYRGSIPQSLLIDYLTQRRIGYDVWARNEGGEKDRFMKWLQINHPALMPKQVTAARPMSRPARPKRELSIINAIGA
jgi:hypothetical protein